MRFGSISSEINWADSPSYCSSMGCSASRGASCWSTLLWCRRSKAGQHCFDAAVAKKQIDKVEEAMGQGPQLLSNSSAGRTLKVADVLAGLNRYILALLHHPWCTCFATSERESWSHGLGTRSYIHVLSFRRLNLLSYDDTKCGLSCL